jgi:hypothetical protein
MLTWLCRQSCFLPQVGHVHVYNGSTPVIAVLTDLSIQVQLVGTPFLTKSASKLILVRMTLTGKNMVE